MGSSNTLESDMPYSGNSASQILKSSRHKILPPRIFSFFDENESSSHRLWNSMLGTLNYENLNKFNKSPDRSSKFDKENQNWNSYTSDCNINGSDITPVNTSGLTNINYQNGLQKSKNNFGGFHTNGYLSSQVTEISGYSDGSGTVKMSFNKSFDTDNSTSPMESRDSRNSPTRDMYSADIMDHKSVYRKDLPKHNTYLNNHFSISTSHSITSENPLLKHSSSIRSNKSSDNSINSTGCPNDSDTTDMNDMHYSNDSRIIQSKGKHIIATVHNVWNSESCNSANTLSVKKDDKVELIARCDDWIYVKMMNPNSTDVYGWIPEYTLVESELLSRKFYNTSAERHFKSL
ncbi:hypothetical protein BEWA_043490 [Theileria equi strain WA]|uniref:SH3 domain-containing protein n=1 Tax=Theileria equi strain WA TaxID=1537102 RepID=L1LGR6_THEEQ|nr:hypothetical protein BEWA_043490 [Theileria equi strain WA]EKX74308.1 hypothetical protein BEWA_043490 [Theileria equi strain WA]|eukprot:XP_004833760.1 hypothetical protein BEWA_043490 [Theileria equi strain WA]